jgi:hypothetical protein
MVPLLLFVSFIAVATGLLALSQATLGVGILVVACFIAIVARIGQAHQQHLEVHGAAIRAERQQAWQLAHPDPVPAPTPADSRRSHKQEIAAGIGIVLLVLAVFAIQIYRSPGPTPARPYALDPLDVRVTPMQNGIRLENVGRDTYVTCRVEVGASAATVPSIAPGTATIPLESFAPAVSLSDAGSLTRTVRCESRTGA